MGENDGEKKENGAAKVVIEIDGEKKEFDEKKVIELVSLQKTATQKAQKAAAVLDAAQKYGLDPEDYVGHAEGAFAAMSKLMEEGIIDKDGNIVQKKSENVNDPDGKKDPTGLASPANLTEVQAQLKELSVMKKALDDIHQKIGSLEEDQTRILRMNLHKEIQSKHSNLSDEDVSKLFTIAMHDPKKSIWQHAEEMEKGKKETEAQIRAKYAKEFGISLEEFDANKVLEQDAKGGGAAAILGGKKLSFNAKENDPKAVTPRKAMLEYMRRKGLGG